MSSQRVVVAFDTSPASVDAARWARSLGDALGWEVVVASVADDLVSRLGTSATDTAGQRTRLLEAWELEVGGPSPEVTIRSGPVAAALERVALDVHADLVVLGSARAAGSLTDWLSSTAAHVAHRCDKPLVVVPDGWRRPGLERVLVGLDGSEPSEAARDWAARLAGATGSTLELVHVDHSSVELAPPEDPHNWRQRARERLSRWSEPVAAAHPGLRIDVETVWDRDATDGLLGRADESSADLIVVGAHGLGGITGARLGGTAMSVLHHARRPVALVPPPST